MSGPHPNRSSTRTTKHSTSPSTYAPCTATPSAEHASSSNMTDSDRQPLGQDVAAMRKGLSTLARRLTCVRPLVLPGTSRHLAPNAHGPGFLTRTSYGQLQPAPASRLREPAPISHTACCGTLTSAISLTNLSSRR